MIIRNVWTEPHHLCEGSSSEGRKDHVHKTSTNDTSSRSSVEKVPATSSQCLFLTKSPRLFEHIRYIDGTEETLMFITCDHLYVRYVNIWLADIGFCIDHQTSNAQSLLLNAVVGRQSSHQLQHARSWEGLSEALGKISDTKPIIYGAWNWFLRAPFFISIV
jgi:hypothetical protein